MPKEKTPAVVRKQCGTVAGYRQHSKRGEEQCDECRAANREYQRRYRAGEVEKRKPGRQKRLRQAEEAGGEVAAAVHEAIDGGRRVDDQYPAFLKYRGRKLWDDVTGEFDLNPAALAVLAEACRMADRLERFSAALASHSALWFELAEAEVNDSGDLQAQVVVNGMVGEARQMQAAVATALSKIGVLQAGKKKGGEGGMLDQLAKKRQERMDSVREAK